MLVFYVRIPLQQEFWPCLKTFSDIKGKGCYRHPWCKTRIALTTCKTSFEKDCPAPNLNSAEAKNPCSNQPENIIKIRDHAQVQTVSVQFSCSVVPNSSRPPWTTARQASPFITIFQSPPKLMSIESVMPSNHIILCCPLLLLPSILSSIRVFSNESVLRIRWPKY